jgi:hypothetical protein
VHSVSQSYFTQFLESAHSQGQNMMVDNSTSMIDGSVLSCLQEMHLAHQSQNNQPHIISNSQQYRQFLTKPNRRTFSIETAGFVENI